MPTYDYACAACGHRFEVFESINADGPKECPKCGKKKARRRLGIGAGLIFKGSGFYTTDSRSSPPPVEGGDGDGGSDSGSKEADGNAGSAESGSKESGKKKTKNKSKKEPKK